MKKDIVKRIGHWSVCYRIGFVALGGMTLATGIVGSSARADAGSFAIGGAVYTSLVDPHLNGLEGVEVCVACNGRFAECATTPGGTGVWTMLGVPEDTCTPMLHKSRG